MPPAHDAGGSRDPDPHPSPGLAPPGGLRASGGECTLTRRLRRRVTPRPARLSRALVQGTGTVRQDPEARARRCLSPRRAWAAEGEPWDSRSCTERAGGAGGLGSPSAVRPRPLLLSLEDQAGHRSPAVSPRASVLAQSPPPPHPGMPGAFAGRLTLGEGKTVTGVLIPSSISSGYFSCSEKCGKLAEPGRQRSWIQAGWEDGAGLHGEPRRNPQP